MKIFLDTANVEEIQEGAATGVVSGVTTNPTIISRENKPFAKCIDDILAIDPGLTVLVEVIAPDTKGMITEARKLSQIADTIVVKIPMTAPGMAAVKVLSQEAISTAATLVFSVNQAITASCANVIAASIRTPQSVGDLFSEGCDIVTMPGKIFHAMFNHPLTDAGLKQFMEDWRKVPEE